jgi:hypothetical protein
MQMQAAVFAWLARQAGRPASVPVIFAILAGGAPILTERLDARGADVSLRDESMVLLDTASFGEAAITYCRDQLGARRLVYGSDSPVLAAGPTLSAVRKLGEADAGTILAETPKSLFAQFSRPARP